MRDAQLPGPYQATLGVIMQAFNEVQCPWLNSLPGLTLKNIPVKFEKNLENILRVIKQTACLRMNRQKDGQTPGQMGKHDFYSSSSHYWLVKEKGPWFKIKIPSYQYRKSHCGDKTVVRSSYLHNGISYTGKMTSLYWIRVQVIA